MVSGRSVLRPSLVIFDCDGVLVDSEGIANRVLAEAVTRLGHDMDEAGSRREFVGLSMTSVMARIEAMTGHDDLAHALAFALQPRKRSDGRWYVGAARATDPAADPVPARVLGRDVELVSTGGGVELPREPAVQSVDGAEVLAPVTEPMNSERLEAVSGR